MADKRGYEKEFEYIDAWIKKAGRIDKYEICAALMVHFGFERATSVSVYNLWIRKVFTT